VAPVLQCPDCGQKHPLDDVRETPAFHCSGCGRMLKVPPQLLPAPAEPPVPSHFPPRRVPASMRAPSASLPELPRVVRFLIWIVALPLAFVVTYLLTRLFGLLTQRQLEDTFLRSGWDRFWPITRVLPVWALVTALLVHFGNIGIARVLAGRKQGNAGRGGSGNGRGRGARVGGRGSRGGRGVTGAIAPPSAPARNAAGAESPTRTSHVP
jgi:uncharacterized membrane protein YgcG